VQDSETPLRLGWRFCVIEGLRGWRLKKSTKDRTCQPGCFAVVSDLPIKRLTQATRKGQSKLAAEQGNFAGPIHPYQAARGESSHRKGITPRGKRRPHPVSIPKLSPAASLKRGQNGRMERKQSSSTENGKTPNHQGIMAG
jgi:hypothetical protein